MVFGTSMGRWMVAGLVCWLGLAGPGMAQGVPLDLQARILQREDERNLNGRELTDLLQSPVPAVRERVALALGRIGERRATSDLLAALERERVDAVRRMIVFALGEIEDPRALEPLLRIIGTGTYSAALRARAAEAIGKLPEPLDRAALTRQLLTLLSALLPVATVTLTDEQAELTSLVVTALTRLRAPEAVEPLASLLKSTRPLVRAAAANGLARLRQPLTAVVDELIVALGDADPEVRANAARALGVARDNRAAVPLTLLLHDRDERVVVSAVRALGMLPESKPAAALLELGQGRLVGLKDPRALQISLLCEVATVLGTLRDPQALPFLTGLRRLVGIGASPEVETALAALGAEHFYSQPIERMVDEARRHPGGIGNLAKGMAIVGDARSRETLLWLWGSEPGRSISRPELLRALARLKPQILPSLIGQALTEADPVGQAVAAELMAGLEPAVARGMVPALLDGWRRAPNGANDGQLAILRALARTEAPEARKVLEEARAHPDYLVRRLAAELLGGDTARVAIVATGRTLDDYRRIVQRLDRAVDREVAITLRTTRGVIELELFPREAPLTVDNLVSLVRRGYFSGITFHRVVPNFVIQGGDPRGDGEGGPGYQIRCEINYRTYGRGTLGMALSGKDTGGSQFFITHSAQPHLDGGYTVFGQVRKGMEVVDQITRGDLILEATVAGEASRPTRGRRRVK